MQFSLSLREFILNSLFEWHNHPTRYGGWLTLIACLDSTALETIFWERRAVAIGASSRSSVVPA